MNLLILTENDKIENGKYVIDDYRSEHITGILKLGIGDKCKAGILNSQKGMAVIESMENNRITLAIDEFKNIRRKKPNITLICALPRPQILKKVLFVSAMMGIENIHLIRSNRVEKSFFQSPLLLKENYEKYLLEGMSQGENIFLPNVIIHDRFRPFFEDYLPSLNMENSVKLFGHLDSDQFLSSIYKQGNENVMIAVGPEGGWVDFETDILIASGFLPVCLSEWNLRVEYAVTAFLTQIELLNNRSHTG